MKPRFNSNIGIIFLTKSIRTFCYGFLGVYFPLYLIQLGLDGLGIGIAITATLLASTAITYIIHRPARSLGTRVVLIALSFMIILSALLFLLFRHPWIAVLAAMIGNIALGTGETGPFLTLEQVIVSREAPRERLSSFMSLYNFVGYVAGAIGAAWMGMMSVHPTIFFSLYLAIGIAQFILYIRLTSNPSEGVVSDRSGELTTEPLIQKIAALFALDAFAGGFIIQSILVYWFSQKFQLSPATIGWIFFGTQLMSGASFLLAPTLAQKIGLVKAMVFSHLISNVLLIGIAFMPSAMLAIVLLLVRHSLSQIDVPTRQTFLMLVVKDHERERAASLTNMSRTLAQSISPAITGWIMHAVSLSSPFVLGGGLKIIYDLLLLQTIRTHSAETKLDAV